MTIEMAKLMAILPPIKAIARVLISSRVKSATQAVIAAEIAPAP